MSNLYWSIYKNLERDVIDLSNHIHFNDEQLAVYSTKIAELLIRCSIEIESISKDLYENEGGNMVPTDENVSYVHKLCLASGNGAGYLPHFRSFFLLVNGLVLS
jgi:hypothetical protein